MRLLIIIIASFAITHSASAQEFTLPVKVNSDSVGTSDRSPMMSIERGGAINMLWVNPGKYTFSGPIFFSRSTDGGKTFSAQTTVCADANCYADFAHTPQCAIDTKGNLHIVWMAVRVNSQADVWYVRSTDHGATWTTPITVCDAGDSSKFLQDFPSIACDSENNLYVSFLDARLEEQNLSPNYHLYFTTSTNGGTTWSNNIKADSLPKGIGGTCECCPEKIAASGNGNVFIVFRSNINNIRNMWLARSHDGGKTFEPSLDLQTGDWTLNACPISGPNIALDDSIGANVVWRDARDDSAGIGHLYYAYVAKGSNTTPQNISFDTDSSSSDNYPNVAIFHDKSRRAFVYPTFDHGTRYVLYDEDSVLVKNCALPIGTSQQFAEVAFAPDGTRYICYQDNKNDAGDIYFCAETTPLASLGVAESTSSDFNLFPNPVTSQSLTVTYSATEPASLKIVDLLGRNIYHTELSSNLTNSVINVSEFAPGIYQCLLESRTSVIRKSFVVVR